MDEDKSLIWSMYQEIGAIERHFNELESSYRTMASTWLLASFAAIGYVLTTDALLPAWKNLMVAGIGFSASIGLYLLWTMDLLVYHRLLDSAFIEGRRLESRHSWLPQIRHNMMRLQAGKGSLQRILLFYMLSTGLMLVIGSMALLIWAQDRGMRMLILCGVACAILIATVAIRMAGTTGNTSFLEREILSSECSVPVVGESLKAPNPRPQADS